MLPWQARPWVTWPSCCQVKLGFPIWWADPGPVITNNSRLTSFSTPAPHTAHTQHKRMFSCFLLPTFISLASDRTGRLLFTLCSCWSIVHITHLSSTQMLVSAMYVCTSRTHIALMSKMYFYGTEGFRLHTYSHSQVTTLPVEVLKALEDI